MLNKHTMALFVIGVVLGLLLTSQRHLLWDKWFVIGGAIGFLIFLPNLIWMARNGFPFFELLANIREDGRNVSLTPFEFLRDEVMFLNPLTLPLWLGGLAYFFFHPKGKQYRVLGWAFLIVLAALLGADGRTYYLAPGFPMLFAGGAVLFEGWARTPVRRWIEIAYIGLMVVAGVLLAPTSLPVLPPEKYVPYTRALGIAPPEIETANSGQLPQLLADRFGWPEMAQATASVYNSLTPEEQAVTAIFGESYTKAGAIDLYGPALGLPKAIGGHLNYWYWGPRDYTGEIVIALGSDPRELRPLFEECVIAGGVQHKYAMPRENFPIYLCRGIKTPLAELWPEVKKWD
jgi:hypothetical protein